MNRKFNIRASSKPVKNHSGMSLILVMIAAAVGIIIMTAMTQFMVSLFRATTSIRITSDIMSQITLLSLTLEDSARCNANIVNLGSATLLSSTPATTKLPMSKIEYPPGSVIVQPDCATGVRPCVKAIYVTDFTSSTPNKFIANLTVEFSKPGTLGSAEIHKKIPIRLVTDASNTVTSCTSTSLTPGQIEEALQVSCDSLGGAFDSTSKTCTQGAQTCTQLGGTWSGADCSFGGSGSSCDVRSGTGTWSDGTSKYKTGGGYYTFEIDSAPINCLPGETMDSVISSSCDSVANANGPMPYTSTAVGNTISGGSLIVRCSYSRPKPANFPPYTGTVSASFRCCM